MRVVESKQINWGAVRQDLGLHVEEMDMPMELDALYASASTDADDELSGFDGWDMSIGVPAERKLEAAVMATVEHVHDAFAHIAAGYWRHPVSLPGQAVERILSAFGFGRPESVASVTPIGRIAAV